MNPQIGAGVSGTSDRVIMARIAAHTSWAQTPDREARTRPARTAFLARFERQVDPDGVMPPAERKKRAESAKRAYFQRLALRSALSRRDRRSTNSPYTSTG